MIRTLMMILATLVAVSALGAAELRPAATLAAELIESRIEQDDPDAHWLQAVVEGLRSGEIGIHEANTLVAMIGHLDAGTASGATVEEAVAPPAAVSTVDEALAPPAAAPVPPVEEAQAALTIGLEPVEVDDDAHPIGSDPAPDEAVTAPAGADGAGGASEVPPLPVAASADASVADQALAALDNPESEPEPMAAAPTDSTDSAVEPEDPLPAAASAIAVPGELVAVGVADPADPVAAASSGSEEPLVEEPAVTASQPAPPGAETGSSAQAAADAPSEPAADSDPDAPALAKVVHVKSAATPDDPDLVMVEGTRMSKGQTLALRRSGQEVVRLLVLRVEGTLAMAMILDSTWTESAERPVAIGDQVYPLSRD